MNALRRCSCLLAYGLFALTATAQSGAPPITARPSPPLSGKQVWLGGITPFMQRVRHLNDPSDYMELFQPGSPWPVSGAGLKVFKISDQTAHGGPDEELRTMFAGLRSRHIALAIEMGLIAGPLGGCGKGIEGFGRPEGPKITAQRIKNLGGVVDYIDMDEPVVFGHMPIKTSDGRTGCQYSIETLVDQVVARLADLRAVFPNIEIGDTEPIGGGPGSAEANRAIIEFETQLKRKTQGAAPAFFHADVQWQSGGWRPNLEQLGLRMHAEGIRFGVICDGGGTGIKDSVAWIANALKRCGVVAADTSIAPDDFNVQTWEPLPTKMLPETNPGAMTFAVKQILITLR